MINKTKNPPIIAIHPYSKLSNNNPIMTGKAATTPDKMLLPKETAFYSHSLPVLKEMGI
jgi:hypothetical protein